MSLGPVKIITREDALIWRLVDAAFTCDREQAQTIELCRTFELDVYRETAEAVLENERRQRLIEILRETDPGRSLLAA